jgi:hypothetical protein
MARTLSRMKGRRDGGLFVALPVDLLRAEVFRTLPAHATRLFVAFLGQLSMAQGGPKNNGDLSAPIKTMREQWGFRSSVTLHKAKQELLDRGLIVQTRMGAFPSTCALYAVTFYGLNEDPKLDITARSFPRGAWRLWQPGKPVQVTRLSSPSEPRPQSISSPSEPTSPSKAAISSPSEPVGAKFRAPQVHYVNTSIELPSPAVPLLCHPNSRYKAVPVRLSAPARIKALAARATSGRKEVAA